MKVKICGITRPEDAIAAAKAGAWAIGYIFYAKSPRYIKPGAAGRISRALPREVEKVGVFVNESAEEIARVAQQAGLTRVQLHGDETPEACAALSLPVTKVFREVGKENLRSYAVSCKAFLLDSQAPGGVWGGVGKKVDNETIRAFRLLKDEQAPGLEFFLAGGIDPGNVAHVVADNAPDGIDVSSGVEDREPGIKSAAKIQALFKAVKGK